MCRRHIPHGGGKAGERERGGECHSLPLESKGIEEMEIEVLITTNSIYSAGEKNRCNIWVVAFLKTKQAIRNKEEGRGEGRD